MIRPIQKAFILTIILGITMSIAGCEAQNRSDTRKSRLISIENMQLKKQLRQREAGIEKQVEYVQLKKQLKQREAGIKKQVEYMQLKEQLKQCEAKIKKQKKLHSKEIEKQNALLDKCIRKRNALGKKTQETIRQDVETMLVHIMDKNAQLSTENQSLKAEIEQLKKELEGLKQASLKSSEQVFNQYGRRLFLRHLWGRANFRQGSVFALRRQPVRRT